MYLLSFTLLSVVIFSILIIIIYNLYRVNIAKSNYIENLQNRNEKLLQFEVLFNQLKEIYNELQIEYNNKEQIIFELKDKINDINTEYKIIKNNQSKLKEEKDNWEREKKEILSQITSEIIKDNINLQSNFTKINQENFEKITTSLYHNFEKVTNKVNNLSFEMEKYNNEFENTKKAILDPIKGGYMSEITLENILKSSSLVQKHDLNEYGDYMIQKNIRYDDKNLRPDAILFLPDDQIVIIDSKSISNFKDLYQAIETDNDKLIKTQLVKLKNNMIKHINNLTSKKYDIALKEILIKNDKKYSIMSNIIFIQTERMVEIIRKYDPSIIDYAINNNLYILSPIGLINFLHQVKFFISYKMQNNNLDKLRVEIDNLIKHINNLFDKSQNLGISLNKSIKSYNEFISIFNNKLISSIDNLNYLGIDKKDNNKINKLDKIN